MKQRFAYHMKQFINKIIIIQCIIILYNYKINSSIYLVERDRIIETAHFQVIYSHTMERTEELNQIIFQMK